jgi:hypothetical protein
MKAKRRHELHENVLATELGRIVDFLKKRGNHLATGALVVALAVFAVVYFRGRASSTRVALQTDWDGVGIEEHWNRMRGLSMDPQKRVKVLTNLAEQTDNDRIAALAGVELGYEYAMRLLAATNDSERVALAEKAEAWYRLTAQKFPKQRLAVAKAEYGLGKLAESARQWKIAEQQYKKVTAMSGVTGQPVVALAQAALRQLKAIQAPVRMATTRPAPATRPATTQPASRPATTQPASRRAVATRPGPTTRPVPKEPAAK